MLALLISVALEGSSADRLPILAKPASAVSSESSAVAQLQPPSLAIALCADPRQAHGDRRQAKVLAPVLAFYKAFNEGFVGPAEFATQDWNHINPTGGWTRGREAVLAEVRQVHRTFLRGVAETPLQTEVRYAGKDAAVVTVVSLSSPFELPGRGRVEGQKGIRTFVVVRNGGGWQVLQDHATAISGPPPPP